MHGRQSSRGAWVLASPYAERVRRDSARPRRRGDPCRLEGVGRREEPAEVGCASSAATPFCGSFVSAEVHVRGAQPCVLLHTQVSAEPHSIKTLAIVENSFQGAAQSIAA